MRIPAFVFLAALVAAVPAAGAAETGRCVPAGAARLAGAPPHHLYRFLRGPVTACDGSGAPVELGGWADDSKPPLPWPRVTRALALSGSCVALSDFQATAYGGTGQVFAVDLRSRTTWPLGSYSAGAFGSTSFGPIVFGTDCSATWTVTEKPLNDVPTTREASVAPPSNAPRLAAHPGVRPRAQRAPVLSRTPAGRLTVRVALDRAPRAVTVVVAGTSAAILTTSRSPRVTLPARRTRALRPGRRYPVTVIACDDGCATGRFRVALHSNS